MFVRPGRATSFFHCAAAECLADPRLAAAVVAACGSPDARLERLPAARGLDAAAADAVRRALVSAATATGGRG